MFLFFALDYATDNTAETVNTAESSSALTYPELLSADRLEKTHTERLYEKMGVSNEPDPNNPNILIWNDEQINAFLDPLAYIN